jgi:hypothetical protein
MAVGEGRQSPINAVLAELVWLFNIIHNISGLRNYASSNSHLQTVYKISLF